VPAEAKAFGQLSHPFAIAKNSLAAACTNHGC
jgi:hypothetical protein